MTGVTEAWRLAIMAFQDHALYETGWLRSTVELRVYHLRHVARGMRVPPWEVDARALLAWWDLALLGWQPNTARAYRTTLRAFYGWAARAGHVPVSPAVVLRRVESPMPNPSPVPDDEFFAALALADPDELLMLVLAADHGMRRGEVAQVHPSRDLLEDLTGWSLRVHGKGAKQRIVPLTDEAARALRARGDGYAFPGRDHGHLSARWIGKRVSRLLPGDWTMHKLRHRAGQRWYDECDGDVFVVQELLGHADPKTTRIYVRPRDDRKRATVLRAASVRPASSEEVAA